MSSIRCLPALSAKYWRLMTSVVVLSLAPDLAPAMAANPPAQVDRSDDVRRSEILGKFPDAQIVTASETPSDPENGYYFELILPKGQLIAALVPKDASRPIAYAVQNELLVTLKQGENLAGLDAALKTNTLRYSVVRQISRSGVCLLRTDGKAGLDPWTAANSLLRLGTFTLVEPNQILMVYGNQHGLSIPAEQWSVDTLGLADDGEVDGDVDGLEALSRLKYSLRPLAEVIVAVIDTGASVDHPALKTQLWTNAGEVAGNVRDDDGNGKIDDVHGWNFFGVNANLRDNNAHGTHVAGIIAAKQFKPGVAIGLAPNAKLMILKVSEQGESKLDALLGAIDYAVENGAKVINMSLGSRSYSQLMQDAVTYAADQDVITIASAGNADPGLPPLDISLPGNAVYPCLLKNITLCVTATDRNGSRASYSNFSSAPWSVSLLAAPGTNIWSSVPNTTEGYARMSGTSMAAPHVAAAAAILRGLYVGIDGESVRMQLMQTAEAGPRLDLYRAISTPKIPDQNSPLSYCNALVEGTPRTKISPFASSWESYFDGSTVERSHRICTLQQFFAMNSLIGQQSHFALVRDLDWSDIGESDRTRIGSEAKPFEGTFHGAGHTLKNYLYELPLKNLGLFAKIGPRGRVSDFRMTNARLSALDNVGALAGINEGVIDNVQVEGVVQGTTRVGGVVGVVQHALGGPSDSGRMSDVFFEGRVKGTALVGGIAGLAANDAKIEGAFAKGLITASGIPATSTQASAGGLVGEVNSRAQVEGSLAIVKVEAADNSGGLIGALRCGAIVRASYSENVANGKVAGGLVGVIENGGIQNAYSLAIAFGSMSSGGLVGKNQDNSAGSKPGTFACSDTTSKLPSSKIENAFFLNANNSPGAAGQAKTLQELQLQSTFANWALGKGKWSMSTGESPSLSKLVRTRGHDN